MQAARGLRKFCVKTLSVTALLAPLAVQAHGLKITLRLGSPESAAGSISYRSGHLDYFKALPAGVYAPASRYAPRRLEQHLGVTPAAPVARVIAGGAVAIDDRTFVLDGVYYRLADAEPLPLGTPESIAARKRLQALLDGGRLTLWPRGAEPSGIRLVSLRP